MKKNQNGQPFIVKYVDFTTVRLMDSSENYHPSVSVSDAKRMAQEAGLDLVCFNRPDSKNLALCKIVNFGKWKYSTEKKKKKDKQSKRLTKEIRLSPVMENHDVEHKLKHAKGFIADGHDVLFSMRLKGRQRVHFSEAVERMDEIIGMCSEYSKEVSRKKSSNIISVRVSSNKKEAK